MTRLNQELDEDQILALKVRADQARRNIIEMTTLAKSGHPGGPLGSADMDALIHYVAEIDKNDPFSLKNDIIIRSAGHYSAGDYAAKAQAGLFPADEAVSQFRKVGSIYEGHVSHKVSGVWIDTGVLGQGLSAGVGLALGSKMLGYDNHIFVCMGDGEQNKGQVMEAARFAFKYTHPDNKYKIDNLTVIVDDNANQLSGPTAEIMPMHIRAFFEAAGWRTEKIDGHSIKDGWEALQKAQKAENKLTAIIAETIMGMGYEEIHSDFNYHGAPLSREQAVEALSQMGYKPRFDELERMREQDHPSRDGRPHFPVSVNAGERMVYTEPTACRNAWGKALESIAGVTLNKDGTPKSGMSPMAVFDCDLMGSVKTGGFAKKYPDNFFQSGIMEHHTAAMAGAMSILPISVWYADFGVFSVTETYQQHRLTAINDGNLKLISTHCGPDVGEDGKTHQAIDFLALNNHPGWQTFLPADANQTDAIVRYMAQHQGNMHLAMGRSKIPVITKQGSSEPFFDESYEFSPYGFETLRNYGNHATICTYGNLAHRAVISADLLKTQDILVKVVNIPVPTQFDREKLQKNLVYDDGIPNEIVTYEDHYIGNEGDELAGLAGVIKGCLYGDSEDRSPGVWSLGVRNYGPSGKALDVYKDLGLHETDLVKFIQEHAV